MDMKEQVQIRMQFEVSTDILWKAVTDKDEMKEWYFKVEEFVPEVGFEFQFWGESETRKYLHFCKITEAIDGKRICYSWEYDGISGSTLLCFDISAISEKSCELILTHKGFETFPAEMNELKAENFEIGWKQILGTSLRNYIGNIVQ